MKNSNHTKTKNQNSLKERIACIMDENFIGLLEKVETVDIDQWTRGGYTPSKSEPKR